MNKGKSELRIIQKLQILGGFGKQMNNTNSKINARAKRNVRFYSSNEQKETGVLVLCVKARTGGECE